MLDCKYNVHELYSPYSLLDDFLISSFSSPLIRHSRASLSGKDRFTCQALGWWTGNPIICTLPTVTSGVTRWTLWPHPPLLSCCRIHLQELVERWSLGIHSISSSRGGELQRECHVVVSPINFSRLSGKVPRAVIVSFPWIANQRLTGWKRERDGTRSGSRVLAVDSQVLVS